MKMALSFLMVSSMVYASDYQEKRAKQQTTKIKVPEEDALRRIFNEAELQDFDNKSNCSRDMGGCELEPGQFVSRIEQVLRRCDAPDKPKKEKIIELVAGQQALEWLQDTGELPVPGKWLSIKGDKVL